MSKRDVYQFDSEGKAIRNDVIEHGTDLILKSEPVRRSDVSLNRGLVLIVPFLIGLFVFFKLGIESEMWVRCGVLSALLVIPFWVTLKKPRIIKFSRYESLVEGLSRSIPFSSIKAIKVDGKEIIIVTNKNVEYTFYQGYNVDQVKYLARRTANFVSAKLDVVE